MTLENADLKRRLDLAETSKSQLEKKNETLKEQVKSLGKNLYDLWLAARKELAAKDSELEHLTNE